MFKTRLQTRAAHLALALALTAGLLPSAASARWDGAGDPDAATPGAAAHSRRAARSSLLYAPGADAAVYEIEPDQPGCEAVRWAAEAGLLDGAAFDPDAPISRGRRQRKSLRGLFPGCA